MNRRSTVFGLVLLALAASPAHADIFGFVDSEGRAHFSDRQLDARYKLYMKTNPAPVPTAEPPLAAEVAAGIKPAVLTQSAKNLYVPVKSHKRYDGIITKVAQEQKLEPALLHAVVTVESGYNATARSPKGATGLMQVMPATGKRYGVTKLTDPLENVRAGARYLKDLFSMFDNNIHLVLAAYNAGEGAVMRSGNAIPNYPETKAYVPRVLQYYQTYKDRTS